jgi:hypothetical protein
MAGKEWDGAWPLLSAAAALMALWLGAAGCSADVFDVQVDLKTQAYQLDFGPPRGEIPVVACGAADVCGGGTVLSASGAPDAPPADVQVALGCDPATGRCFAQADARVAFTVDVLQDDAFTTKIERRAINLVRVADLAYTVPTNTLTVEIPQIDVYVGPAGARSESDDGVVPVDSIHPVAAGVTFTSERHLTVSDDSPARAVIESSIQSKQPFVFVFATAPRVEAGSPIPAGALEIDLYPRIELGFPR